MSRRSAAQAINDVPSSREHVVNEVPKRVGHLGCHQSAPTITFSQVSPIDAGYKVCHRLVFHANLLYHDLRPTYSNIRALISQSEGETPFLLKGESRSSLGESCAGIVITNDVSKCTSMRALYIASSHGG
jgi:hypothetical protein